MTNPGGSKEDEIFRFYPHKYFSGEVVFIAS